MKKQIVRLTESDLHNIIKESVSKVLKEGVNYTEKIQQLIDAANNAYMEAVQVQDGDECPLMDKKGNCYGLKGQITLDKRGYVTIPFFDISNGWGDYSNIEKIRVLKQVNGKVKIIQGDTFEGGWRDVQKMLKQIIRDAQIGNEQKMLKQIIRDAQIGNEHFKNYDSSWEDSDSLEQFNSNCSSLKDMNKKIGRNANAGVEYLNKKY